MTKKGSESRLVVMTGQASALPPIIFESDGSHGLGDWLGLVNAMDNHHRICVWDKLGLGFSDYLLSQQSSSSNQYYPALIDALIAAEPDFAPPYIFVG